MILSLSLVSALKQDVFILNLEYNQGNISVTRLINTEGFFNDPINQPTEGYKLEVVLNNNNIAYSQMFDFGLEFYGEALREWFDDEGNQIYIPTEEETGFSLDKSEVELIFPYFENTKSINIYDSQENLQLEINVDSNKLNPSEKNNFIFLVIVTIISIVLIILVLWLISFIISRRG